MGKRGPPPKPTHLKILSGNPGKRALNQHEPKPPRDIPRCPAWLSEEAKTEWRRMVRLLSRMGLLTLADADALAAYCQTFVRWRAAEQWIMKHGEVYPLRDEKGAIRCMQQFPQVSIARSQLQMLRNFMQEFGLTPSARTRISVEPDEEDGHGANWFPPELMGKEPRIAGAIGTSTGDE